MLVSTVFSPGTEYVSATSSQGQPSHQASNNSVALNLGTLAPGQTVEMNVRMRISATAAAGSAVTAVVGAGANSTDCVTAGVTVTITPAGIPVTGSGPGWNEIRMMLLAGLGLLAVVLVAGWSLSQRTAYRG